MADEFAESLKRQAQESKDAKQRAIEDQRTAATKMQQELSANVAAADRILREAAMIVVARTALALDIKGQSHKFHVGDSQCVSTPAVDASGGRKKAIIVAVDGRQKFVLVTCGTVVANAGSSFAFGSQTYEKEFSAEAASEDVIDFLQQTIERTVAREYLSV